MTRFLLKVWTQKSEPHSVCSVAVARSGDLFAGRYLLGPRLGQGGMGEVFQATDTATQAKVALKLLRDDAKDEDARFIREAKVLERILDR